MPVAQATTRTTKQKRSASRKMSAAHKLALAEGRSMSAIVDRYVTALNTPKQRGRKVSSATLTKRRDAARERARTSTGVDKVVAAQQVRELQRRLAAIATTSETDLKALERDFVRIAKKFSTNRGISYGAWRDAGVPPAVLQRAGIARTRG